MTKNFKEEIKNINGYKDLYNFNSQLESLFEQIKKDKRISTKTFNALKDYRNRLQNNRLPTVFKSIRLAYLVFRQIQKEPEELTNQNVKKWFNWLVEQNQSKLISSFNHIHLTILHKISLLLQYHLGLLILLIDMLVFQWDSLD
ncbi:MAG: hypothetical protein ABIA76_01805 [Candidatus Diapherotrites archaeon]